MSNFNKKKKKKEGMSRNWTVANSWNKVIGTRAERPVEPRSAMWASELAKQDADIYLKMKGEVPSNIPNDRAKRKMDAGNIWEWTIKMVLIRCGILKHSEQLSVVSDFPNLVPVRGKLDFMAGGAFNYENAIKALEELLLPEEIMRGIRNIIDDINESGKGDLDEKVLEIKSVSSFAFDVLERTNKPLSGHDLQTFHYAYNLQKEGAIVYFCRDDARMVEMPILPNDQKLLAMYEAKIERVTGYYNTDTMPPLEAPIVFNKAVGKFSKNFNVEYSSFLTRNYNIENQTVFDEMYGGTVERLNRVLGRIAQGKEMTKNNEEALSEMATLGFDIEEIKTLMQTKFKVEEKDTSQNESA